MCVCAYVCLTMCAQDLIPGYQCQCKSGFRLNQDGRTCRDINECLERRNNCSQSCTNTHGSYKCGCQKGYTLNPSDLSSCLEIDECEEAIISGTSVCQFDSLCVNLPGTYQCGCPPGTLLSRSLVCMCVSHLCVCDFVYSATTRLKGLEPMESDFRQCVDRNECLTMERPCPNSHVSIDGREHESQLCENLFGGWSCSCLPGSRLRHEVETLTPIDERNALMYSAEDITWRFQRAQKIASQVHCDDIDECEENPRLCLPVSFTNNFSDGDGDPAIGLGESERGKEREGVLFDAEGDLQPSQVERGRSLLDETRMMASEDETSELDEVGGGLRLLAVCVNSFRGYSCACPVEGLVYDRLTRECVDLNECALGLCGNDPQMKCTNLDPGYECRCNSGYQKRDTRNSGLICVDINECQQDLSPCPPGSHCVNKAGSFDCVCEAGDLHAHTHTHIHPTTSHTSI